MSYTHIACTNERGMRVIQPFAPLQLSFVELSNGTATAVYYIAGEAIHASVREKFSDILEMMVATGVAIDCTQERKWDFDRAQVEQTPNPNYEVERGRDDRFSTIQFRDKSLPDGSRFPQEGIYAGEIDRNTPARLIENLKKQLAAKDDELSEAREVTRKATEACKAADKALSTMGIAASVYGENPLLDAVKEMERQIWERQTEIHRLNGALGQKSRQIERLQKTLQEYQTTSDEMAQPEPPATLSDESQGIKGDVYGGTLPTD